MAEFRGFNYECENEACPQFGEIQRVKRDAMADCASCGWSMRCRGDELRTKPV